MRGRLALVGSVVAALGVAAPAHARVVELGADTSVSAASSCPGNPCSAIYQVTGYQGRSGNLRNPFVVRRDGYLVAFTLKLPELAENQITSFSNSFGGPPQARIAVLRRGEGRKKRLNHRLVRQSQVFDVQDYLGSSPTFVFSEPIRVGEGTIVALTVPTWLPALAGSGLGGGNWWRASRPKGRCGGATDLAPASAQQELRQIRRWGCTYTGARLLYTVTYIPDPRPTVRAGDEE